MRIAGFVAAAIILILALGIIITGTLPTQWGKHDIAATDSPALQEVQQRRVERQMIKTFEKKYNISCDVYFESEVCLAFGERIDTNPELASAITFVQRRGAHVALFRFSQAHFVTTERFIIINVDGPTDEEIIAYLTGGS